MGSENVYQESEGSSACLQSEQKELKTLTLQSRDSGEIREVSADTRSHRERSLRTRMHSLCCKELVDDPGRSRLPFMPRTPPRTSSWSRRVFPSPLTFQQDARADTACESSLTWGRTRGNILWTRLLPHVL